MPSVHIVIVNWHVECWAVADSHALIKYAILDKFSD